MLLIVLYIIIFFGLYGEPKIGFLFTIDFLPDFVRKVNIFISVGTRDLAWFKVGFVYTFLAILEIKAHVVILKFCGANNDKRFWKVNII